MEYFRGVPEACPRGACVLLAEDDLTLSETTRFILQDAGFWVDVVENGVDAVNAVRKKPYSLILMDCQMPEMDGYEATQILRKEGVEIPITAFTSHAHAEVWERCQKAGMTDYFAKPFKKDEMIRMVERHTRSKKPGLNFSGSGLVLDMKRIKSLEDLGREAQNDLMKRLIALYRQYAPRALQTLKDAHANSNTARLRREAHQFKSSSGNLGLNRVYSILKHLEDDGTPEDLIPQLLESLDSEVELGLNELIRYEEND